MYNNWLFQLPGILFILVLLKVYFSRKRLVSIENNIYVKLIIANLVSLLLDVFSVLMIANFGPNALLSFVSTKLYLASVLVWLILLTTYIYVVSFKKMEKFSLAKTSSLVKLLRIIIPLGIIGILVMSILPIDLVKQSNAVYFKGDSAYALYVILGVCISAWLIRFFARINYIKGNRSRSILFAIMITLAGAAVQIVYPEVSILTFVMYFITFTIYFSIENPDLELMKELEAAKKRVEETEVSKKDSLLKVSHSIRTPLNAISGFTQSIIEGTSENVTEDIKYIETASQNLLHILNNIIDVSDVDMDMYKLVYDEYNADVVLKQIGALAKSRVVSKKVQFNITIDDNIPQCLFGDSIRLKEVVLNVVCNAIKYTEVGYINLNIGCIIVGNICRLLITVKDTGIGISEDDMDNLFKAKSVKNKELMEGVSDLNLATIKEIVESMNGQITVESEYRDGTTVTIVIDQKICVDPEQVEQESAITEDARDNFSGKRVLVVDDDKINLKVASRLLKSYDVQTDEVSNGFSCIEKIKNGERYDLIFLDDWMPNMSGVETMRELDRIEGFNTPVVALTANATAGMKEEYLKDGFNDYIPKPIERKELDRVIRKFLNN